MTDRVTDTEIKSLRAAINEANNVLVSAYGKIIDHETKDKGIVTKYDLLVENRIKEILSESLSYSFLAEETAAARQTDSTYWAIDPIDSTTAFAHANPLFAVSIALIKNGEVVLGAVSNPPFSETYIFDGQITTLNGRKVLMANTKDTPIVYIDNGYSPEDERLAVKVAQLLEGKIAMRQLGSTALELAYVAAGRADLLITIGDEIWDYAGGLALVRGSGGLVKDFKGEGIGVESRFIIAGFPYLVDEFVPLLKNLQL